MSKHDGEDDPARARAGQCDTNGDWSLGGELRCDDSKSRYVDTASPEADTNTLCEEYLPIVLTKTESQHSKDNHAVAKQHQAVEISHVEQRPGHCTNEDDQKGLNTSDPGDGQGG